MEDERGAHRYRLFGENLDVEIDDERPPLCRLVTKSGVCAVGKRRGKSRREKLNFHFSDVSTSLVEMRWRWIFGIYAFASVFTWWLFAVLWWLVAYNHGDLLYSSPMNAYNDNAPCVLGVHDFPTSFLFSLETQYTTGYGTRSPTDQCPEAILLLCFQSVFGSILNCLILGLVFTKAARPKARSSAIIFTKKAAICCRDGILCLLFKVADMRKYKILAPRLKAYFVTERVTEEGEILKQFARKMELTVDEAGLIWPVTVCHKIDRSSPLYELSALDLLGTHFEIVVVMTGTLETTGQMMEARTSYVPCEVLWGQRFTSTTTRTKTGEYNLSKTLAFTQ